MATSERANLLAGLRFTELDDVAHRLAFLDQPTVDEIVALMHAREKRIFNEAYEKGIAAGKAEGRMLWQKRIWRWFCR